MIRNTVRDSKRNIQNKTGIWSFNIIEYCKLPFPQKCEQTYLIPGGNFLTGQWSISLRSANWYRLLIWVIALHIVLWIMICGSPSVRNENITSLSPLGYVTTIQLTELTQHIPFTVQWRQFWGEILLSLLFHISRRYFTFRTTNGGRSSPEVSGSLRPRSSRSLSNLGETDRARDGGERDLESQS